MTLKATFVSGDPTIIDYTPVSAVTAGSPQLVGVSVLIPHHDIDAGVKGSVSAGPGVYNAQAVAGTYADASNIYWDNGAKLFTGQVSGNTKAGTVNGPQVLASQGTLLINLDNQFHGT